MAPLKKWHLNRDATEGLEVAMWGVSFHVEGRTYTKDRRQGHVEKWRSVYGECTRNREEQCKNGRCAFTVCFQQQWWAYPEACSFSGGPALWPVACAGKVANQGEAYVPSVAARKKISQDCTSSEATVSALLILLKLWSIQPQEVTICNLSYIFLDT